MMFVRDEHGEESLMSKVYNPSYNYNQTCYRRTRTRKFNLNMSWYKNLYRRTKRIEHLWTFYHNPLEGMAKFICCSYNTLYQLSVSVQFFKKL